MMQRSEELSKALNDYLISVAKDKEDEITSFLDYFDKYLKALNIIFSKLRMEHGTTAQETEEMLQNAVTLRRGWI